MNSRSKSILAVRQTSGSSIIELGGMGFIISVMAVICVNVGILVFAAWTNDAACRDATRAAAQQSNSENAQAAAVLAAKQFGADTAIIGHPVVLLDAASFKYETFPDDEGSPQHDKGPRVTVTTRLNTKMPCPFIYNGTKFTDVMAFKQTYTYPLLNPDYKDTDDAIDPALAAQEEDSVGTESDSADADGADENN